MSKMELLCEMWKYSAEEYMVFLKRNGVKCFGIQMIYSNKMAIYVDEQSYLELSASDERFNQEEKQILKLTERAEKLADKFMELAQRIESNKEKLDELLNLYGEDE